MLTAANPIHFVIRLLPQNFHIHKVFRKGNLKRFPLMHHYSHLKQIFQLKQMH